MKAIHVGKAIQKQDLSLYCWQECTIFCSDFGVDWPFKKATGIAILYLAIWPREMKTCMLMPIIA